MSSLYCQCLVSLSNLEQGELDCDLLQAAGNVGRAMAVFVNKVDASIHSDVRIGVVCCT